MSLPINLTTSTRRLRNFANGSYRDLHARTVYRSLPCLDEKQARSFCGRTRIPDEFERVCPLMKSRSIVDFVTYNSEKASMNFRNISDNCVKFTTLRKGRKNKTVSDMLMTIV